MANIVLPGSYTPPPEAPESVVHETPNPLLDTTNGSLRRRRAKASTTFAASDKEEKVRPRTLNLFQAHGAPPYSDDVVLGNHADGRHCWVMFYIDNDDALEELRHSHGVVAVRRGAEARSWLIQFKSPLLAAKAEASYKGRLVQESELEALTSSLLLDRTMTTTLVPHHNHDGSFSAATNNVPNIWLHSKDNVVVAGSNNNSKDGQSEVDSPPPCWKVLLRYFLGLEDQPTRFVGVRH
jgi:hypothetical protein